ncbi:MAG: gluconate kinase, family [Myxococcaceae bacterium]|nr:gluconate kinase, family [Myxococcaceae bacterium]
MVVMGVSGSGKSSVGRLLAERAQVPYADGDSFHSVESKAKMAAGHPLTDDDRWPWLARVGAWLAAHEATGAVVSCSALKRVYRDALRRSAPRAVFLHLTGEPEQLAQRMRARADHFMPATLLHSQLATLEPLQADERGVVLEVGEASALELAERGLTLLFCEARS